MQSRSLQLFGSITLNKNPCVKQTCRPIWPKQSLYTVPVEFRGVIMVMRKTIVYIWTSVTKCHKEQTVGPRSTNSGAHVHAKKVSLYADFHQKCQRLWPHFQGQSFESSTLRSSYVNSSQMMTNETNVIIASIKSFDWQICIRPCDLVLFWRSNSRSWTPLLQISLKWWQINKTLLLSSNIKVA